MSERLKEQLSAAFSRLSVAVLLQAVKDSRRQPASDPEALDWLLTGSDLFRSFGAFRTLAWLNPDRT